MKPGELQELDGHPYGGLVLPPLDRLPEDPGPAPVDAQPAGGQELLEVLQCLPDAVGGVVPRLERSDRYTAAVQVADPGLLVAFAVGTGGVAEHPPPRGAVLAQGLLDVGGDRVHGLTLPGEAEVHPGVGDGVLLPPPVEQERGAGTA